MDLRNSLIVFNGFITTTTPYANSPAGAKGPNKEAMLPRVPVGGEMRPVIASAAIRAALRQAATREVIERAKAAGAKIAFRDVALWSVGGVKGSGKEAEKVGLAERAGYGDKNVLIGVFGAGESPVGFVTGGLQVDVAIAPSPAVATIVEGSRRPLNDDPILLEALDSSELNAALAFADVNQRRSRLQDEQKRIKTAMRKAAGEERAALDAQLKNITGQLDSTKAEAAEALSDVTIGMPLAGYEVIGSGVTMPHTLRLSIQSNPLRLGLLLAALERFGLDPRLGAHEGQGCGYVSITYDVAASRIEGRRRIVTPLGKVTIGRDEGARVEGQELMDAVAGWDAAGFEFGEYSA
jgi:hypothetical protein